MLTELAQTDKAMSYAYKNHNQNLYEELFNIRLNIIADWKARKVQSQKQFINLINWCAEHNTY